MSTVRYAAGFTRNMGDFESLRIDVDITDDSKEGESTAAALKRIKEFVNDNLLGDIADVEKDIRAVRKQVHEGGDYKRKVQSAAKKMDEEEK